MKKIFKGLLPIVLIISVLSISVFPVNAVEQTQEESVDESNIETYFHEGSGTLIVSGTGEVKDLYPRATGSVYCDTVVEIDTSVKHLVIDDGITSISNSFNDLHNLQDILFPETLKNIEGSFNDCDKIKSVDFPSSLDAIGSACFNDCDDIKDLYLNDNLREINFSEVQTVSFNSLDSLKSLYIPGVAGVNGAFSDCSNLRTIYYEDPLWRGVTPPLGELELPSFRNSAEDAVLYANKEVIDLFIPDGETGYRDDSMFMDAFASYSTDEGYPEVVYLDVLPSEIHKSNGLNGIELSWDCLRVGYTYFIYRSNDSGSGYELIGTTRMGEFTDTTAKSGKKYSYRIKCSWFNLFVDDVLYLSRPVLKSVVSSSSKTATVKWNKVEGAKGYYVYRSATGEAGSWTRIANIKSGDTTSYTAKDLKKGSDYYFCVKAYSGKTASASSAKKTVTVGEPVISATTSSNDKITVKWNKITDVKYYRVYMKNKGVPSYTTVATIKDPSTVSYSRTWKFDSKNTACVRVRAFYKDGTHQISEPIEVKK